MNLLTSYWLDGLVFESRQGREISFSTKQSTLVLGARKGSYSMGTGLLSWR